MKIQNALFLLLAFVGTAHASDEMPPYNHNAIVLRRFGEAKRQRYFAAALELPKTFRRFMVGQDDMGRALQTRLVQYLSSCGKREQEPVALHLVGTPGVGKTTTMKAIEAVGIPVERIDAQDFDGGADPSSTSIV